MVSVGVIRLSAQSSSIEVNLFYRVIMNGLAPSSDRGLAMDTDD